MKFNNKIIKFVFLFFTIIVIDSVIFNSFSISKSNIIISYHFNSDSVGTLQVFYTSYEDAFQWNETNSMKIDYQKTGSTEIIKFEIPATTKYIRIDFFDQVEEVKFSDIILKYKGKSIPLDQNILTNSNNLNDIKNMRYEKGTYSFTSTDFDPYIQYEISNDVLNTLFMQDSLYNFVLKLVLCFFVDLIIAFFVRKSKIVINFLLDLYNNKTLIWNLSKNDFKTKYAGSYLGIFWAFVQPIVTILIYWFVFEYGLKAGSPVVGVPFILWFVAGLIPWFFFQEALINATNCMSEYSYLVKKVVFKINVLPIVKIISSLLVHAVFISFTIGIFIINGIYPRIFCLQLLYYTFCSFILILGISYATSSIIIFFKDLGQLITILLQILMWMTPIMWSSAILPPSMNWFPFFNPIYYIVDGFRDALINNIWFWEKPMQTLYFWGIALLLFLLGTLIFKRLRPHFADVL